VQGLGFWVWGVGFWGVGCGVSGGIQALRRRARKYPLAGESNILPRSLSLARLRLLACSHTRAFSLCRSPPLSTALHAPLVPRTHSCTLQYKFSALPSPRTPRSRARALPSAERAEARALPSALSFRPALALSLSPAPLASPLSFAGASSPDRTSRRGWSPSLLTTSSAKCLRSSSFLICPRFRSTAPRDLNYPCIVTQFFP